MKFNGRTLKRRLYGLTMLPSRVARVRYFRGHGVHSPFVYRIVRQVFMKREFLNEERAVYEALLAHQVAHKRAMQLQNLAVHCAYRTFAIDAWSEEADWLLLTPALSEEQSRVLIHHAATCGKMVALLTPYAGRERSEFCKAVIEEHRCTSVDNRGFLLLFTHPDLPKQHYRI